MILQKNDSPVTFCYQQKQTMVVQKITLEVNLRNIQIEEMIEFNILYSTTVYKIANIGNNQYFPLIFEEEKKNFETDELNMDVINAMLLWVQDDLKDKEDSDDKVLDEMLETNMVLEQLVDIAAKLDANSDVENYKFMYSCF
jgi:hypothetical protein